MRKVSLMPVRGVSFHVVDFLLDVYLEVNLTHYEGKKYINRVIIINLIYEVLTFNKLLIENIIGYIVTQNNNNKKV